MIATHDKRLIERMGGRVDREAGVIRGVKLLGRKSRNKRAYTREALQNAVPKYKGKKVYFDHPDRDQMGDDRKFRDWVGVVENAQFRGDGIFGDIRLRKQSEHFEALIEAAESFDGFFGMSHVAEGDSHFGGGEEIVESIVEVYSVDIVTEPATATGLFESIPGLDTNLAGGEGERWNRIIETMVRLNEQHNLNLPVAEAIEVAGLYVAMKQQQEPTLESHSRRDEHHRDTHRYSLESLGPAPPICWND